MPADAIGVVDPVPVERVGSPPQPAATATAIITPTEHLRMSVPGSHGQSAARFAQVLSALDRT
jgi:hypothetical protein